uniref:Rx N-terminal domain-containing protein n=1 Tax=Leersia perrieri TaxID=77586 RepID=A0A0D9XAE1_9ORYZ
MASGTSSTVQQGNVCIVAYRKRSLLLIAFLHTSKLANKRPESSCIVMAESLLLPVVRGVAGKAADALVKSITTMCGIDNNRCKLERHLLAVQCLLADAEAKSETNPAIKRWMKDIKAVAYEADDVLDDFHYEALRREAVIGDSSTRKVLGYFTASSPHLFRLTMSKKLSNVLKKIDELVEEMNKFGLVERAESLQLSYRQTHSGLDKSVEIFGRDHDKEVMVEILMEQQDEQKLCVLPIVGMGDNFEVVSLLKAIIELATDKRCKVSDTIELLRRQLEEAIGRKRFLLVLDDVWNEDEVKWDEDLRPLLNSVGGPGSIIVVTTRSQRVASIMKTRQSHELARLSEDESWELFSRRAFGKVQEQTCLVTIGKRIAKKCKGLPLALKTMDGLMSSKQQVQEWEAIARSNIGDTIKGKDEILSILKLSYKHLPSEMKQCFTFCAIFSKDYEMEKDMLIQLWIANGFIQEDDTIDLAKKEELTQQKSLSKDVWHMQISRDDLNQISGLLKDLPKLESWAENSNGEPNDLIIFPKLESLTIISCELLSSVPKSPALKDLSISRYCGLPISLVEDLASLSEAWFLDQFGVLHDGKKPYPGAVLALEKLAEKGAKMVIISNSSRRSSVTMEKLKSLGFDPSCFLGAITSGELTHQYLQKRDDPWFAALGRKCVHLTWGSRGAISLEGLGLQVVSNVEEAEFILAHGTEALGLPSGDPLPKSLEELEQVLLLCLEKRLPMVVANPDYVTVEARDLRVMPGTLAAKYESLGGDVKWMGKPDKVIYTSAMSLAGGVNAHECITVGDSLHHDIKGANSSGVASAFITGGIHLAELGLNEIGENAEDDVIDSLCRKHRSYPTYVLPSFTW